MFANIHTKVRVDSLLREQNFRFEIGLSWGESSGSAGSERWFGWFFPFNWICQHFFFASRFYRDFDFGDVQSDSGSECCPCARSRIPISRSHFPATFVSQTKSTHFVEENPNLLLVISAELRMLPNERFCSPSLKRSSFLGNKGHVRDCPYQSM